MSMLPDEFPAVKATAFYKHPRTQELKKIQADAEQISVLVADPRWEFYGRYLEVRKKAADLAVKAMEDRLLRQFMPRQEYAELSNKLAGQRGLSAGLDFALTIAQVLIEQGERAVEELKSLTSVKEGNIDEGIQRTPD